MADVILDCLLDPPLDNWTHKINCRTIPMLISGVEALATYLCDNPPSGMDEFIELTDTPASYAGSAGMSVVVNVAESGLEFVPNVSTDELVKVSANDTTPNYLFPKLAQGNGITLAEVNDGGDEDVSITVNEAQLSLGNLGARSHTSLTDIGTNTHAQIDTHIASVANPHTVTLEQARTANSVMSGNASILFSQNGDACWTIGNDTSGAAARSGVFLRTAGGIDTSFISASAGYTVVPSWASSSVFASTKNTLIISNIAGAGVIVFQAGGSTERARFSATGNLLLGTTSDSAKLHISQSASTGTQLPSQLITSAAHTALTASTERNEVHWNFSATQQFATGAIATQRAIRIQAPTYSFVGASTITEAATLYISGAPIQGTNATITSPYALWIDSGELRQDGNLTVNGVSTLNSNLIISSGANIGFGTGAGTKIGTGTTQKLGFWNATPVVQDTGWGSITNVTPDKAYDANATTLDEISDVLGTLIAQLVTYGILGA